MNTLRFIFNHTLNSVVFGIGVMLCTGLYIAIGSGMPSVRELFEMNELQFFNAWPLKVLMGLLVMNLTVVTWVRIPLTWPRLGVWMIHCGIVTLIFGMGFYYALKVEGLIYIGQKQTIGGYYDGQQRSLYIRYRTETGSDLKMLSAPMPSLPRFKTHIAEGDAALAPDLKNRVLAYETGSEDGRTPTLRSLSADLGLPKDITFDVIGYHPYATISTDFEPDPAGKTIGVQVQLNEVQGAKTKTFTVVWSDPAHRLMDFGPVSFEHWHLPMVEPEKIAGSSSELHKVDITIGDFKQSLPVQVGKSYELGSTGYSITVEAFNPAFPMSGTGEMVKMLTLMVKTTKPGKVAEFRRMVIDGKPDIQTDFKLNEPGAGPMGKRQKEPLDTDLKIAYTNNDPLNLIPRDDSERHVLITADQPGITHITAKSDGTLTSEKLPADGSFKVGGVILKAARFDNLKRLDRVTDVPPAQRQRMVGESGDLQVLTLRVKIGENVQVVHVPFVGWAKEPIADWRNVPPTEIPGTQGTIQVAFGNTWRWLPAKLTLEHFELVNYPGGTPNDNLFRDFVSTLRVENKNTGEQTVGMARMNQPIYFDSGRWLFYQAQYDKQNMATIIGIGNRPGVGMMTGGCVLMAVGLLYAFYLKPIIIRKRKERAIREAGAKANGNRERAAVVQR